MVDIYERLEKVAQALNIDDFDIVERGYFLQKGEKIIRCLRYVAWGQYSNEKWEAEVYKDTVNELKKYLKDGKQYKLIYRVSTIKGCSRLYIIEKV